MKIKYRISDGEILAWGAMQGLQAGAGEAVEDSDSAENLTGKIRVSKGEYRDKTDLEKESTKPQTQKRLEELKSKKTDLTISEINEVLKLKGIL